jgi:hypothetical protein
MSAVSLQKELTAITENKVGMLARVSGAIAEKDVNIQAISAYALGGRAYFRLITDNNPAAAAALKALGCEVTEREVVVAELPDEVGQAKAVGERLKKAGIDLGYMYGTNSVSPGVGKLVFNSNDNHKAVQILSQS